MVLYLIDYENVKNAGLVGIDRLSEEDNAVIFYSPNADMISFDMHHTLVKSKCSIDFYKIKRGGKNFLDFQLSTYLGYKLSSESFSHAVIISRDQGFDSLLDFWESGFVSTDTKVLRFVSIGAFLNYTFGDKKPKEEAPEGSGQTMRDPAIYTDYDTETDELPEPVEEEEKPAVQPEPKKQEQPKNPPPRKQKPVKKESSNPNVPPQKKKEEPKQQTGAVSESSVSRPQADYPEVLGKYPADERTQLLNCLKNCDKKKDLYITLIKGFGKKKGCEFYHDLKNHFDEIKNHNGK